MSQDFVASADLMAHSATLHSMTHAVLVLMVPLKPAIPLNPPDIVSKNDEWFSINMNNMERSKPYMMTFEDSKYVFWKTKNDSLVIREV